MRSLPGWCGLLLAGLAQAGSLAWPFDWGWPHGEPLAGLQLLSLAALVGSLWRAPDARAALARGWVWATAWLAGTFWWLYVSMHTYGGLSAPLAVLGVLALAALLALFYALAAMLAWRWRDAALGVRLAVFAALWTLAELARGTLLTGFPWGAGGYALIDGLAPLAPWIGVYGLGAVGAALAVPLAETLLAISSPRVAATGIFPDWRAVAGVLVLLPALFWPGIGRYWAGVTPDWTVATGRLPVTLLQGNIPQDEKFQPGSGVAVALAWYGEQARAALARDRAGLVIAPETAIPLLPRDIDPAYWNGLMHAVARGRSALMLGQPLGSLEQGYTNSVTSWMPGGAAMHRYDKQHLVPFGEFIPPLFRWFTDLMQIPLGDFSRGALVQPPLRWAGQRIGPDICYEDLFGEELARGFADPAQAPTVLVNLSNIGWFGDTLAIAQHRQIARMRALELQRPMLRATNTGATMAIDHRGRISAELPRLTRGTLDVEVEGRDGLTPYARWAGRFGLWPLALLGVAVLLALWRRTSAARRP